MSHSTSADHATAQLEKFGYKQELSRSVTTFDLVVYGLVFMVPIAPWAIFGSVYNESKGMVPLVYLIGVIAMIFTALSYSQMAKAFPLAGGVFSYVGRGINPNIGFFAGWLMLLDYLLVPTLLYIIASESMIGIFPNSPRWLWGLIFVAINVTVNLLGVSSLKMMNRVFLVMELIFVAAFIVIAIIGITGNTLPTASWSMDPIWNADYVTPSLLAAALSIAVLSFLGFDGISTLAEETTSGSKAPGKAMIIGLLTVATLFISQTWLASLLAGPFSEVPEDRIGNFFFDQIEAVAGSGVVNAFFICNVLAVGIANSMAAQAATSRLLFSMARDKQIPSYLRHINSKKVPSYAIITVGVISAILVVAFAGQINTMSSMVNFGALASFSLLHIAVIWFYLKRNGSKNFLSHLLLPLIGFCIIFYVLINAGSEAHVAGLIWLAIGFGFFLYNKIRGNSLEIRETDESIA